MTEPRSTPFSIAGCSATWRSPPTLYTHGKTTVSASGDPAHVAMRCVHRVVSLLKRWLLEHINKLSRKYRGTDFPRPQNRVIVRVSPGRIHDYLDGPPPDPSSSDT